MRVNAKQRFGDHTLTFVFDVESDTPAKLWGPPENCYPAEGGDVTLEDVQLDGVSCSEIFVDVDGSTCVVFGVGNAAQTLVFDDATMTEFEDKAQEQARIEADENAAEAAMLRMEDY